MYDELLDYDLLEIEALERMGQDGFVNVEPAYGGDELFHDQFNRRAREITRQPNQLKPVHLIPQKRGPWTANNQLGIEVPYAPSLTSRFTEQTILKLDEWDFPEVWSVMLGMNYSDDLWGPSATASFNTLAVIRAGVGGVTQDLEIDWQQGTTFSLNMNALNVVAKFAASVDTPEDLVLRVSIAKGKLAGRPPQRSFQIAALVTGGLTVTSARTRIPAFSKSVMAVNRSVAAAADSVFSANFAITFHTNPTGGGTVGGVTGTELLAFAANGFPIPPFARYFQCQASAPAVAVSPSVLFFLGL